MPASVNQYRRALTFLACATALAINATGCARGMRSSSVADVARTQVQFYAPQSAAVVIRGAEQEVVQIQSRGPTGDRLEHSPEEFAVFDVATGTYSFAYGGAPGADSAVIYGTLEVRAPGSEMCREYRRHSFIPIRLPSALAQAAEHLHPSRDLSYTVGLEGRQFDHLKQGDMITQVYFVADLTQAKHDYDDGYFQAINDIERRLVVLSDQEDYLDHRYNQARSEALQRDPELNIEDQIAYRDHDFWGVEETYIKISRERQKLAAQRDSLLLDRGRLTAERDRRDALLRSMNIVNRAGALVLATPDLSLPFRDAVEQASELGEVVAVVRVGGRHEYWAQHLLADMTGGEQPGGNAP